MKLTKQNRHVVNGLPEVLQEALNSYPFSPFNNMRKIIKGSMVRIYEKFLTKENNMRYVWLSQLLWGVDLDYTAGIDDGEGHALRRDITDPELVVADSDNGEVY